MSNSSLASYAFTDHQKSNLRKNSIYNPTGVVSKITIHHMAGSLSLEQIKKEITKTNRDFSCNYAIDNNGKIGLFVPEDRRSWCSSSRENDYKAITIEVANDGGAPDWHVSGIVIDALIKLCVDICRRNKIEKLNYTRDKNGTLTMHCYFASTACPGPYLKSQFPLIAAMVNKELKREVVLNPNDKADWKSTNNDFIISASMGDRQKLKDVCDELKLPVKNYMG